MRFLDCQNFVLNGRAAALETPGEPHQNVEGSADDYFIYVEDLGAGGFGEVDSVIGEMSLVKFARKRIKRHRLFSKDKATLHVFENELQTLKSLSHRHLVRLVGSYTDSSCVGLIMTPVADMNLATYLRITMNPESRMICLRRFFGCLAAALSYLHGQRVQHKDIKPANILVKQQHVYLTDFGTSRSWDNDASRSTLGTVAAFTPRYCAPEVVQFGSSRNQSRDVWSLGCVFLEMCSVLADHTVEEMWQFLKANGTHGEYIRENSAGVNAWKESLKSEFSTMHDQQPLELAIRMCTMEAQNRPIAKEILSTILDFAGPIRYYGLCCDEQRDSNDYQSTQLIQPEGSPKDHSLPSESMMIKVSQEAHISSSSSTKYHVPTAEDPTEDPTVQAFFPPGGIARKYILEDPEHNDTSIDLFKSPMASTQSSPQPPQNPALPASSDHTVVIKVSKPEIQSRIAVLDIIQNLDFSRLQCPWPNCSRRSKYDGHISLAGHLREHHGTHELFWTPLIGLNLPWTSCAPSSQWIPGQIISGVATSGPSGHAKAFVLRRKNESPAQASTDPFADHLRYQAMERRRNLGQKITDISRLQPEVDSTIRPSRRSVSERGKSKSVDHDDVSFSLLPEDRRPEPVRSEFENRELKAQEEAVIGPERLSEPSISSQIGPDGRPTMISVPRSSLAPSYFLATANQFSTKQLESIQKLKKPAPMPPPLFVYGSFMFPSVIRAQAERSILSEGVYSSALQRRIYTTAEDWSNTNKSLQQAAQQMTPALLPGHLRFVVERSKDAALMPCPGKKNGGITETKGFLIVGLSYEAHAFLDYLLSPEGYSYFYARSSATTNATLIGSKYNGQLNSHNDSDNDSCSDSGSDRESGNRFVRRSEVIFQRSSVTVTISDSDGNLRHMEALTYVWHSGPRKQTVAWNPNEFVKCRTFSDLSTNIRSNDTVGYDWVADECDLASEMGMLYAMPGDELCDRIVRNDVEGVVSLITHGGDVDASCHHYGTPLQAAAANGHENLVYVMLKFWKADPNKHGGRYNSPLVAAICNGHGEIVNELLRYGANPISGAGTFVSPIYQAVSFEDIEMTHMLLEKGAWLTREYDELLDLAAETGNGDLCILLQGYDICNLHERKQTGENRHRQQREWQRKTLSDRVDGRGLIEPMPAVLELWSMRGQKGKWTGTKAIKVLRMIYGDNIPLLILDILRENLHNMHVILSGFSKGEVSTRGSPEIEDRAPVKDCSRKSDDDREAALDSKHWRRPSRAIDDDDYFEAQGPSRQEMQGLQWHRQHLFRAR
ncbi:MAG: hypothetical protein Q9215_006715 [Flavoplaca cf. flavocitrina]